MAWYDFDKPQPSKREYLAKVKYDNIVTQRAQDFDNLINDSLVEGLQYRIITERSFNAIAVIEALAAKYAIEKVTIAVYRMNIQAVRKIKDFIDDFDIECTILLSSFFRENKKYERWTRDLENYATVEKRCKIGFAWSHAKVFLAKTKCGMHIVFEGSGNLSDNARIEQYLLENNQQTYCFHEEWITEVVLNASKDENNRTG